MNDKTFESKTSDLASDFSPESRKRFDAALGRLVQAVGGGDQGQLAAFLGISRQAINSAIAKNKIPPAWYIAVGEKSDISIDWLVKGEGSIRCGNANFAPEAEQKPGIVPEDEPRWMSANDAAGMGYGLVPKVRARLSAGTGSLETEGDVIGLYAFKNEFLRRKGCPKKMVLMDVAGDSMEPEIWSGDTVLIDQSQNEIIAGGLFAVGIDANVLVKYIDALPGKIVLRSRNERYAPIEVNMTGDLAEMVRIIGRVVWSCREYVR